MSCQITVGGASGSYSTLGWLSLLAVSAGGAFMAGRKSRQAGSALKHSDSNHHRLLIKAPHTFFDFFVF
jgi:hypothetical protein